MTTPTLHDSPKDTGWIEVIVGCMFSGKTEELIRRIRRAQIARQRVAIFKPRVDNRYSSPTTSFLTARPDVFNQQ